LEGFSKSRRSSFEGEGFAMVVASKHKVMDILQGMQIHDIMCEGMVKIQNSGLHGVMKKGRVQGKNQ
jgi:hypothetical protein